MSLQIKGKRRIATVPIYRAERIYINGRDVTPRIRGLYDGKKIVLTRYALKDRTEHHEIAHSIDDLRHGHIVESHARQIGFSKPRKIGVIGFDLRRGFSRAELKKILNDDTKRVEQIFHKEIRAHPAGCQCPYHGGHKRKKAPAMQGIGKRDGYKFTGRTGFVSGGLPRF